MLSVSRARPLHRITVTNLKQLKNARIFYSSQNVAFYQISRRGFFWNSKESEKPAPEVTEEATAAIPEVVDSTPTGGSYYS
jgi:hypothetical protein